MEFSLNKVGIGNCEEDEIISSEENLSENNLSVFPNPTSDILNINTDLKNFTVQVYTINSVAIKSANNQFSLDVSSFEHGTYILNLLSANGKTIQNRKFVVMH